MKRIIIASVTILGLSTTVQAENFDHLRQLLATKQCQQCDLVGVGLVMSNLAGAQLSGANLTGANLSQANLSGADLSGANLTGASLNGANLTGANLRGAILNSTDFRGAYLTNADFTDAQLNNAYLQGAEGIPPSAGTPELFYSWGLVEAKGGNFQAAIEHYNNSISLDAEYAPAYLARGFALYRLGQDQQAEENAKIALTLFEQQENQQGYETTQSFIEGIEEARKPKKDPNGGWAGVERVFQSVGGLLLQFLLAF